MGWSQLAAAKSVGGSTLLTIAGTPILSRHKRVMLQFKDVLSTVAGHEVSVQIATGATPTFQGGASDYVWGNRIWDVNGDNFLGQDTADTDCDVSGRAIDDTGRDQNNAAGRTGFGEFHIYAPGVSGVEKMFQAWYAYQQETPGENVVAQARSHGRILITDPITSIRIKSTQNIDADAQIILFGLT